jgi:hypothetical protein
LPKQQWNSPHLTQQGRDFCLRQHNRDSFRLLCSFRIEIGEFSLHHIAKQEQQRIESLILSARRDLSAYSKITQEFLELALGYS